MVCSFNKLPGRIALVCCVAACVGISLIPVHKRCAETPVEVKNNMNRIKSLIFDNWNEVFSRELNYRLS